MKTYEIAEFVGGKLYGSGDLEIRSVASIDDAKNDQIAFFEKRTDVPASGASCIIVPSDFAGIELYSHELSFIASDNPKLAIARIAAVLHPPKSCGSEIHPTAIIAPTAQIGSDVFVSAFTYVGHNSKVGDRTQMRAGTSIGDNVIIGNTCVLHPNVIVEDDCEIGDGVVLHAGVVIGADGFGYVKDDQGNYVKFPQIGRVVIENNVEIGANTCVDRGALGVTRIGEGTKIDNLVQVGHNVDIGKRCVIAAQTGISGSVVIEDDCVVGGQVGFGDHVRVQSGAIIGSQAGVLPGKIVRPGIWWGTPIQPLDQYKRQNAHLKGIERLQAKVKDLKERLTDFEKKSL